MKYKNKKGQISKSTQKRDETDDKTQQTSTASGLNTAEQSKHKGEKGGEGGESEGSKAKLTRGKGKLKIHVRQQSFGLGQRSRNNEVKCW